MNDSCYQPGLMSFEDALERLLEKAHIELNSELLPIEQALAFTLSDPIISPINVPAFDNSAMDGYAVRSSDVSPQCQLKLQGKSLAGHPYSEALSADSCVRIMTGAPLPAGADAVIMQERDYLKRLVKPSRKFQILYSPLELIFISLRN